ncbi:MAG: TonB-dependent receptor [Myxococcales bacterium]|nr:TonB-dependent receptor [Myxococcales bacterium]
MVVMLALAAAEEPVETVIVRPDTPLEARSPASVTVLDVDGSTPEGENLAGLVGRASGVAVTRLGGLGDLASISLRGSSARQVEVYLDGVPLNPDGSGAVDLSELPLRAFERVEIWRGNAPVGLGGTAMGGVVNLVTGDTPIVAVAGTAGSFGSSQLRGLVSTQGPRGVSVWASGQVLATTGRFTWFDDRGTRFDPDDDLWRVRANDDTRLGSLQGRVRFGQDVRFTVFDSLVAREEGVPGPTAAPSGAVRYGTTRNLAVLQVERGMLRARVHHRIRGQTLRDPAAELDIPGGMDVTRTQSLGLDLQDGLTLGAWGSATALVSLAYDARSGGGERFVSRVHLGGTGVFGPLTLAPAVASVRIASRGAGESTGTVVLPRLGALVRVADRTVVKANAGRYFRPPDLTELFGNRGAIAGRPDLRPERGTNGDLAVRVDRGWGSLELGGFGSVSEDLVVYVQNAQRVSVPTNLGAATVAGTEGALAWTGLPWLDARTNLTLQHTVDRADEPAYAGRRLPRLPWIALHQQTAVQGRGWRVGQTFSLTDGVFLDPANLERQPTRPVLGVFGRVERGGTAVELDLRNVTNIRTGTVPVNPFDPDGPRGRRAITDFVGYPLPGRSVWLSVRWAERSRGSPP